METQAKQKNLFKFFYIPISIIFLLIVVIWFIYGTISPCEMIKKEVASQARKQGGEGQVSYVLFGGFIDRAIDTLSPTQCISAMIKIKTGSSPDEILKSLSG